ncbi:pentapeptide repeat protein [Hyphomicrobium denitrificans 1NES1]|uniref:Pentapeptide repeat protein n=1 Tax=Hyphomicrobium denitrificans 1NES1 TaxID=670307 RepID=N0B6U9_9HYPH|nr:pentapeptide repeat-containing protein [Hyphomicrobium denitrificans]AGK56266.1 pentapeptide repeat protein [Hyphomicrobium denitrificans 1NES1]
MPLQLCRAVVIAALLSTPITGAASADQPLGPVPMHAEISAHAITTLLHKAKAGERPDLSGKFLVYLDLSELDFKGANLARSDFYGTDFTGANLSGVDLSHTRLDRSVLIRANLSGANLTGATIYRPTIYSDLSNKISDAPRFPGANLSNVHVQAELSGSDFRGADLTEANFFPLEGRPGEGTMTTTYKNILKYCDFSGARLHGAHMQRTVMWFAKFTGADLTGADFTDADLSRADFAGADISGAVFTRANFEGASFVGVKGIHEAIGLDQSINLDRALR